MCNTHVLVIIVSSIERSKHEVYGKCKIYLIIIIIVIIKTEEMMINMIWISS